MTNDFATVEATHDSEELSATECWRWRADLLAHLLCRSTQFGKETPAAVDRRDNRIVRLPVGSEHRWPFQTNPSASTITRCDLPIPFPNQPGARVRSLPVQALQPVHHRQTRLVGMGTIESLSGLMIKVAKTIGLDLEGQDGKQQMPRQVRRRRPQENALPAGAQPLEIEIAQLRDFSSAVYLTTIPSSTPTCFCVRCRRIESRA